MRTKDASPSGLRLFLGLTLALSWGVGGLYLLLRAPLMHWLGPLGVQNPIWILINCAPSLAALIAAALRGELRSLLARLVAPFHWAWLPTAALFVPAIALILSFAAPHWDSHWSTTPHAVLMDLPLIMFATSQIVGNVGPIGEELGWRGYALPLLLKRMNAVSAGLVLGLIWALWHIPGFFISGVMVVGVSEFAWWTLGTLGLSLAMTFLYVRAHGNTIVAGVVPHFVINAAATAGVWLSRPAETVALAGLAVFLVLVFGSTFERFSSSSANPAYARQ